MIKNTKLGNFEEIIFFWIQETKKEESADSENYQTKRKILK